MNRWPTKPRPGVRCDAHIPCATPVECDAERARMVDPGGTLHLHRCPKLATETVIGTTALRLEIWLCDDHAEHYEANGHGRRNPKRAAMRAALRTETRP